MEIPTRSKAWILKNKPESAVDLSDGPGATFALTTIGIPSEIPEDSILVKTLILSNDPAQRSWIQKGLDPKRMYAPPLHEGEIMRARAVARVIKVGGSNDTHNEGDLVLTAAGWAEYDVVKKGASDVLTPIPEISPSIFLGALGFPGLTAYWGLTDVLKLQRGETVVISGAAGAVGNVAVQLAKNIISAKVIAIAGSEEKCEYVKSIGADVSLNYKSPSFWDDLVKATPDFVETLRQFHRLILCPLSTDDELLRYFDNVGGTVAGMVMKRLKRYGRIATCGAISAYNDPSQDNLPNYSEVIMNRLEIKGFIVLDYFHRPEALQTLMEAYKGGKLVASGGETLVEVKGIEEVPKVWHGLFEGRNLGKLVTKLPE